MGTVDYPPEFNAAMVKLLGDGKSAGDEGGYVNNPSDPGGETKYGISKRSYPAVDIPALTRDQAIAIYYRDWWQKYRFDQLSAAIAGKTFNLAVNMGAAAAIRCLQRACRACGQPVAEDGVIGQMTADVTHTLAMGDAGRMLMAALRSEAAGYYRLTAAASDKGEEFIRGWLNRAYE